MTPAEAIAVVREALAFDYLGPDPNDMDGEKWGQDPAALAALALIEQRMEELERWNIGIKERAESAERERDKFDGLYEAQAKVSAELTARIAQLEEANKELLAEVGRLR